MEVATIAFSLVTVRVRPVDCHRPPRGLPFAGSRRSAPPYVLYARRHACTGRSPTGGGGGGGRRSDKYGSPIEFRLAVIFSSVTYDDESRPAGRPLAASAR
jgi:hypothetical protein